MENNCIELELTDMASEGEARGRYNKKVFFVPYGVAGDLVRARPIEESRRYTQAEIVEIVSPSPHRVEARCPHFGVCGGCQWQHIDYPAQLEFKRNTVIEQLRRRGGQSDPPVEAVIGMAEPWGYLNQVDFFVGSDDKLGLLDTQYQNIVPIEECLIVDPWLWDLSNGIDLVGAGIRSMSLRSGLNTDEALIIFESIDDLEPELELDLPISCVLQRSDESIYPLVGDSFYHEILGERTFRISSGSFFHVNTAGLEVLLSLTEQYLAPTGYETLLDLFCGVGTFGVSLAGQVGQVIEVEGDPFALEDARTNGADLDNFMLVEGLAESTLESIHSPVHLAIVDPPRDGCPPGTLEALNRLRPQRIVYLSNNVFALARDASRLSQMGYHLQVVQPVDMFPQTRYTETVSLWSLSARK